MNESETYRALYGRPPKELLKMEASFPHNCAETVQGSRHSAIETWIWDVVRIWKFDICRGSGIIYSTHAVVEFIAKTVSKKGLLTPTRGDIMAMVDTALRKVTTPFDAFNQVAWIADAYEKQFGTIPAPQFIRGKNAKKKATMLFCMTLLGEKGPFKFARNKAEEIFGIPHSSICLFLEECIRQGIIEKIKQGRSCWDTEKHSRRKGEADWFIMNSDTKKQLMDKYFAKKKNGELKNQSVRDFVDDIRWHMSWKTG